MPKKSWNSIGKSRPKSEQKGILFQKLTANDMVASFPALGAKTNIIQGILVTTGEWVVFRIVVLDQYISA